MNKLTRPLQAAHVATKGVRYGSPYKLNAIPKSIILFLLKKTWKQKLIRMETSSARTNEYNIKNELKSLLSVVEPYLL